MLNSKFSAMLGITLKPNPAKVVKADAKKNGTHLDTARGVINEGNPDVAQPVVKKAPAQPRGYKKMLAKKIDEVTLPDSVPVKSKRDLVLGTGGAFFTSAELQSDPKAKGVRMLKKT